MNTVISKTIAAAALVSSVLVTLGVISAASPLDGLTVPPADPALVFVAPSSDQPNYGARLEAFLQAIVPDQWNGQPVQFLTTLDASCGLDAVGLPTSQPAVDPNNPNFVYQRFENGVLFYNGTDGSTNILTLS